MRIFLDENTVIILSLSQLKMRILRFTVHSVLATKYWGELKKLVGRYVVEEMLPLNMVDSPSFVS